MYGWLTDALQDRSQVITASRRLARVLSTEYGNQQVAAGRKAWRTPEIWSWQDWLVARLESAHADTDLPARVNAQQSRVLWERCINREVKDPLVNVAALVRQVRDTWIRLHDWNIPVDQCAEHAQGHDQRMFIRVARSYLSMLERENWIDDSGLAELIRQLIHDKQVSVPGHVTLAGFDRIVPCVQAVLDELQSAACIVDIAATSRVGNNKKLYAYENSDAEMRAAGAWARQELGHDAELKIGIVASDLEQEGPRRGRLVREGLVPGWQNSPPHHAAALNVSLGRPLVQYKAIADALLVLRWVQGDLGARDISLLLRSPLLSTGDSSGRARLELKLRELPDRSWSPKMVMGILRDRDDTPDALDWLERVSSIDMARQDLLRRASPSDWAIVIDDLLTSVNWPGDAAVDSFDFQLINRWRDLLNDLARLELVSPVMTLSEALTRLRTLATETVFQAESTNAAVHLLGPLEAAGMEFDRLWVCGLTATNWPPAGKPLSLVSRELQREQGMPDADPGDTMAYAQRVLERISNSSPNLVFSFPQTESDAEQTRTALLGEIDVNEDAPVDPGWNASSLCASGDCVLVGDDPVPPVYEVEIISGGASTIQRQVTEPMSAFAIGRLGVRTLQPIAVGLSASLRGNIIHDALHGLYSELPSQATIQNWDSSEIQGRIAAAVQSAFQSHERFADTVLTQLLKLERARVGRLLQETIALDSQRAPFSILTVEWPRKVTISGIQLRFRIDRIDRLEDGRVVILDYKTGVQKRLLDRSGEPRELQLIVYSCAVDDAVAGLGLVNIDTRAVSIDGAGTAFFASDSWDEDLARWRGAVVTAAMAIKRGDVRINIVQGIDAARPLSLLSRVEELRHEL